MKRNVYLKPHLKNIAVALICFLIVVILNFALPRLLPGDPVAYLTGFAEEDLSPVQYEYYRNALHLNENIFVQFGYYIKSLFDGTLGYSFKKESPVSTLIGERLGYTLQITLPAIIISSLIGLLWGLACGYKKNSATDKISTSAQILLNSMPTFAIGLILIIALSFKSKIFPYSGLNSSDVSAGSFEYFTDRLYHLFLPVLTLVLATLPSKYLLMRNTAAQFTDDKSVAFAKQRGLSNTKIKFNYILKNISQPFITSVGLSISTCIGGSVIIENIFSINGMGMLLTDAVHTLDYPLMQGILFVTAAIMAVSVIVSDVICIFLDPKVRKGGSL